MRQFWQHPQVPTVTTNTTAPMSPESQQVVLSHLRDTLGFYRRQCEDYANISETCRAHIEAARRAVVDAEQRAVDMQAQADLWQAKAQQMELALSEAEALFGRAAA